MDPHHRKIDLQSTEDLIYLKNNILKAAQERLDENIPPSAAPKDGEDKYRKQVEALVLKYVDDTLLLAVPSLSINGLDTPSSLIVPEAPADPADIALDDPTYETYDPLLATRLQELYATLADETERSAKLRREAPATASQGYVERLKAELVAHEQAWEKTREEVLKTANGGLADWKTERSEEMRETWERATKGLEDLKTVPKDVQRLDRAKKAADEVEGT